MRKKIAVFGGGWSGEYLQNVLSGISRLFNSENFDVIAFVNFSVMGDSPIPNIPEVNFFKLPDLAEFAGVVLLANSFNNAEEFSYLLSEIKRVNIPTITIEYKLEGIPNVSTDNYLGMYNLTTHLIEVHSCQKLVYVGGPEGHVENQERLKAFTSACKENGIEVSSKDIYYADWSKTMIPSIIDDWFDNNENCPDVFVCANDIMAMAVVNYLKTLGLSVPNDVKVTGYDCTRLARHFSPSIASVSHEWSYMGEIAAIRLMKTINGEPDTQDSKVSTVFVPGESCGCNEVSIAMAEKGILSSINSANRMDPIDADSHYRHFYLSIKKARSLEEVYNNFSYLFKAEHEVEGPDFCIFLDPEFFKFNDQKQNLRTQGFNDEFSVICQLKRGISQPYKTVKRQDFINEVIDQDNLPALYIALPLYSELYTYGFAVLNGKLNVINENQHYIWTRHMIQTLEFVSNNLLLADLHNQLLKSSVTDEVTKIYNRTGCEKYIYPMLIDGSLKDKKSVIMLIDIDHMKLINDKHGHVCGDQALAMVSSTLQESLPKDFIVSRFGGDEFLVGALIDDIDMDAVCDKVNEDLRVNIEKANISYTLTISVGYHIFIANTRSDIERAIVAADEHMYKIKEIHHKIYTY